VVPAGDASSPVLIHAKLIIVDDVLLRIGSSNLNNRSVGLDTECDLAIEAGSAAERRSIAQLRAALLAEHLGVDPQSVVQAIAAEGSLVRAIEALNGGPRGLRPFESLATSGPARPLFGTGLLDPRRPFEPLWFLRKKRGRRTGALGSQPG
jgi:phosphatidylserine/phosphatidylglycerophosphate/cardiolipin synthase-like enzyme